MPFPSYALLSFIDSTMPLLLSFPPVRAAPRSGLFSLLSGNVRIVSSSHDKSLSSALRSPHRVHLSLSGLKLRRMVLGKTQQPGAAPRWQGGQDGPKPAVTNLTAYRGDPSTAVKAPYRALSFGQSREKNCVGNNGRLSVPRGQH